jgi:hypothetical protein
MASSLSRGSMLLTILACIATLGAAEAEPGVYHDSKAFEGVVAFSQSLAGWALLIAGGSIVTLVGTSYHRPQKWWARLMYLAFLPGWYFLGRCMYFGVNVQRAYLGYLFSNPVGDRLMQFKGAVNDDALRQILGFQCAVYCFGAWLLLYLVWWLCNRDPQKIGGGT